MFQKNKIRKMSLSRALDKYLKTVSVHKKGHLQEFYRKRQRSTVLTLIYW